MTTKRQIRTLLASDYGTLPDELRRVYYLRDRDTLANLFDTRHGWAIFGALGLWDGRRIICPYYDHTILGAIDRCVGRDTEDLLVTHTDGNRFIDVECVHHDGVNRFRIYRLSQKGEQMFQDADFYFATKCMTGVPEIWTEDLPEY